MSNTPETDRIERRWRDYALLSFDDVFDLASRLERERDEWKAKYIQQNKDLRCEMMDPNGTIWDYAKKLQEKFDAQELELFALNSQLSEATEEIEELQEQLNTYIMLDKMAMRKFMRDLEKERQKQ